MSLDTNTSYKEAKNILELNPVKIGQELQAFLEE
jgi:hypothetical protein